MVSFENSLTAKAYLRLRKYLEKYYPSVLREYDSKVDSDVESLDKELSITDNS